MVRQILIRPSMSGNPLNVDLVNIKVRSITLMAEGAASGVPAGYGQVTLRLHENRDDPVDDAIGIGVEVLPVAGAGPRTATQHLYLGGAVMTIRQITIACSISLGRLTIIYDP